MLKFHSIIRPTIPNSFFNEAVDWWRGFAVGNWGPQMYQHHNGKMDGQPMSGVLTWDEHEKRGTIPTQSKQVFYAHIDDAAKYLKKGTPIVEFGPGSMEDAKILIRAISSEEYIPVDCSLSVINKARMLAEEIDTCSVKPAVYDFFSGENLPLSTTPSLGVFLGLTVSNIPGHVPHEEPYNELVAVFKNLTKTIPSGGYLLVSTDSCQDGERNKTLYNEPWHKLFSVNHLYRMANELPMHHFDPDGFEYLPIWHKHCSLLAHTVIATKDQEFEMGENREIKISVKKGQVLHCDNSFKYRPKFFEMCAEDAGLEIIQNWQEKESTMGLYLFHVPPQSAQHSFCAPAKLANNDNVFYDCSSAKRLAKMQGSMGGNQRIQSKAR